MTSPVELDSKDLRTKEKVFSDNIHELKNRLTVIYGGTQLLALHIRKALEQYDTLKYIFPDDLLEDVYSLIEEIVKMKRVIKELDHNYRLDRKKET
jgi:signal transduction histidine kinase